MISAEEVIKILKLQEHPTEGGYFLETYRSREKTVDEYGVERSINTAIYYMLTEDTFSEMHRLRVDEIFHFYLGYPVEMLHLYPNGTGKQVLLGTDLKGGMLPQVLIPAGIWQGARLGSGGTFALMGTTAAPGFEYTDYQSGSRKELINLYPEFKEMIKALTRKA